MNIPKQLVNLSFCRVMFKTKSPFEKDWNNKPYYYGEISEYFPKENYGVLCGYRDLAVIDCDTEPIKIMVENMLPKTFSVKTGGGGKHFYYFIPELKSKVILELDGEHLGEIQSYGTCVIGAGSCHPSGRFYETIDNVGIVTLTLEELKNVLGKYMKITEEKNIGNKNMNPVAFNMKEQIKMSDVAKDYGLTKNGSNWNCPFHDSKGMKSLGISDTNGIFHCFGCGAKGNIIKFVQMLEDVKNN